MTSSSISCSSGSSFRAVAFNPARRLGSQRPRRRAPPSRPSALRADFRRRRSESSFSSSVLQSESSRSLRGDCCLDRHRRSAGRAKEAPTRRPICEVPRSSRRVIAIAVRCGESPASRARSSRGLGLDAHQRIPVDLSVGSLSRGEHGELLGKAAPGWQVQPSPRASLISSGPGTDWSAGPQQVLGSPGNGVPGRPPGRRRPGSPARAPTAL